MAVREQRDAGVTSANRGGSAPGAPEESPRCDGSPEWRLKACSLPGLSERQGGAWRGRGSTERRPRGSRLLLMLWVLGCRSHWAASRGLQGGSQDRGARVPGHQLLSLQVGLRSSPSFTASPSSKFH